MLRQQEKHFVCVFFYLHSWPEGADNTKTQSKQPWSPSLCICMCLCMGTETQRFVCLIEINFYVALANLFNLLVLQNEHLVLIL